ncbi:unnamed protein product [Brachionus calyciflorus]|uniref:Uncharacterized protein n=1 Tax=Brachionus calyciflorus TaxID=104777 RepID=A0A813MZ35_9BILA|nr:unnamed protein product [Brachionus calyciflorus]
MDVFYAQSNLFNSEILQIKKEINYFSSIESKEKSKNYDQKISELSELLGELILLKRDIDESNETIQKYDEKLKMSVKLTSDTSKKEKIQVLEDYERFKKEFDELKQNLEKISNINEFENESRNQILKHQTHESQLNIIKNDYKLIDQIKRAETTLVNCIEKYCKVSNSSEEFYLIKYYIIELLYGVKIIDRSETKNSNFEINFSNWYEIAFTNLPDDVLDFELYSENNPLMSKNKKCILSNEILDKYRSIFKKRRKLSSKDQQKGCVVLNDLDDFHIMIKNYLQLLCFIMSKKEIEEAKKQFAVDWIEGSQVLTILINSKSSKRATVVFPKHYPLCDQSLIKLISLSGYEDSAIKNFKIRKNVENLSEWILELTNLYNNNQIIS